MEEEPIVFEFRIQAIRHNGHLSFEPAIFNQGVPMEFILTMMRSWIRTIERGYDEKFGEHT